MKTKDVVIGGEYLCYIGATLSRVIVVVPCEDYNGRKKFLVRRAGESRHLPKSRSASALRDTPANAAMNIIAAHDTALLEAARGGEASVMLDPGDMAMTIW
jgi:hypothetical protein